MNKIRNSFQRSLTIRRIKNARREKVPKWDEREAAVSDSIKN